MLADKLRAATAAAASVEPVGIDFDGTNDYLSRSSDLVGNADGKTFTFSAFFYVNDTFAGHIYKAGDFDLEIQLTPSYIIAKAYNGTSTLFNTDISAAGIAANTWNHLLISLDLANASNRSVYLNDVATTSSWGTYNNQNIDFTQTTHEIGNLFDGRLAHVFLDYTYRDLSVEANRRLFVTADGKPAGGQASLSPILYLPMDDPANPGRNDGTGGDFTLNGVVAQAGRGPNQYNAPASTFVADTDWLQQSGNAGAASGKVFTFSCVAKPNPTNNAYVFTFFNSTTPVFAVRLRWDGGAYYVLEVSGNNGSGLTFFTADTDLFPLYAYTHFAFSVDMTSQAALQVFINGEEITNITVNAFVDANINFATATTVNVANQYTAAGGFEGELSDLWFDTTYIDLSADNPFYDTETGKPKYLGASGELPTGSVPLIYLPLRADDAGSNKGTGGDFTVNSGPYPGARGPNEFWANSAEFNGTNQYLERTSALTGASDSKTFSLALAFRFDANAESNLIEFYDGTNNYFSVTVRDGGPTDRLQVSGRNATGSSILSGKDESSITLTDGVWYTVLISCDMANGSKRHMYLDGAVPSSLSWDTYVNDSLAFTDSLRVATVTNLGFITDYFDGKIGFLWFNTEYIDFSQEANRLKFFDAFNYPVDLGEDGSLPTGNQPLIYMNNDFQLGTNLGSGGNFTPQNTPTDGGYVKG